MVLGWGLWWDWSCGLGFEYLGSLGHLEAARRDDEHAEDGPRDRGGEAAAAQQVEEGEPAAHEAGHPGRGLRARDQADPPPRPPRQRQ